jgi:transposase
VDEKPIIQPLDHNEPLLPLRTNKARTRTSKDARHGLQTLLAALEIATGKVVITCPRSPNDSGLSKSHGRYMVKSYPLGELQVVLDNRNIHKNEAAERWLLRHRRVHLHYTPADDPRMNMIECFFSSLTEKTLTQSVQHSEKDLKDSLLRHLMKKYGHHPTPFTWAKSPPKPRKGKAYNTEN